MGLIYKRTSPSGKYYIGKTTVPENVRWNSHVSEAINENNDNCHLLNAAIRKYGSDAFSVEILEDNISEENLAEREQYYIEKYHAYFLDAPYMGYNMTRGGEGVLKYSNAEIKAAWDKGLSILQIADAIGCSRPIVRFRLRDMGITEEEFNKRMRECSSNRQSEFELYKEDVILLYNLNYTTPQIAQKLNRSPTTIRKYLKKLGIEINQKTAAKRVYKPVVQLDDNYELIGEYESITSAANAVHPNNIISAKTMISQSAIHKKHKACGYHWRFKSDYEEGNI